MERKSGTAVRDDFHSMNNLLNKITAQAGMTKYRLENNNINLENIEEETAQIIKVMDSIEEAALKTGGILKKLRKSVI